MNFATKSLSIGFFVALLGQTIICENRPMSFELMPRVFSIIEVLSRRDNKMADDRKNPNPEDQKYPIVSVDELLQSEREEICVRGVELVKSNVRTNIKLSKELLKYGEQRKYVVESAKQGYTFTVEMVSAFKCPSDPAMYAQVRMKDEETGRLTVVVIFKDRDQEPEIKDIMVFGIRLAEDITEAYSDEISVDVSLPESTELEPRNAELSSTGLEVQTNVESSPKDGEVQTNVASSPKDGEVKTNVESGLKSLEIDDKDKDKDRDGDGSGDDEDEDDSEYDSEDDSEEDESDGSIENSILDMDDLKEHQRLQMCRRAADLVSNMNVKLEENELPGSSRYYLLTTKREVTRESDSNMETDELRTNIIQAVKCASTPNDIYLNIDDYDDDEDDDEDSEDEYEEKPMMWVIVERGEEGPLFDILIYQLKPYMEISTVSPKELDQTIKMDKVRNFSFDLDGFGAESRRDVCQKAIRTTLRSGVEVMENAEIEESEYYKMKFPKYSITAQVISCPTNHSTPVYVHVGTNERMGKRTAVVYVKDDELYKNHLFPWVENE